MLNTSDASSAADIPTDPEVEPVPSTTTNAVDPAPSQRGAKRVVLRPGDRVFGDEALPNTGDMALDEALDRLDAAKAAEQPPIADLWERAAAIGAIQENQYEGLGWTRIPPGGVGVLSDSVNRNVWLKSLVLDEMAQTDTPWQRTVSAFEALVRDDERVQGNLWARCKTRMGHAMARLQRPKPAPRLLVTGISVSGLPFNVGTKGAPLSMFAATSTRFGITFGRRLALVGQQVQVTFVNTDPDHAVNVSGGFVCDEMNPYLMGKAMERAILESISKLDDPAVAADILA